MTTTSDLVDWIVGARQPILLASILLSIPSILLYLAQIVTVLRHRQLHNSFYAIFVARGISDLTSILNSYYGLRLPMLFGHALLNIYACLPNILYQMFPFLGSYTYLVGNWLTICMHVNRFTAVTHPTKYKQLWRWLLPTCFVLIFTLPLLVCWKAFDSNPELIVANNGTLFFVGQKDDPRTQVMEAWINMARVCSSLSILVACVLLNLATVVVYRARITPASTEMARERSVERRLLVYSLVTLFGHVAICGLMVTMNYADAEKNQAFLTVTAIQLPWITDTGSVALSSWLLLWASASFRAQFLADYLPNRLHKVIFESSTWAMTRNG